MSTRAEKVGQYAVERAVEVLEPLGFRQRPDLDPLYFERGDSTRGWGSAGIWVSGQPETATRWVANTFFTWVIPEVDRIDDLVFGESTHGFAPTVREVCGAPLSETRRRHAAGFGEYRTQQDVDENVIGKQLGLVQQHWDWWTGQFATLDATFDYLARDDLVASLSNSFIGYVLALLHGRDDTAATFGLLRFEQASTPSLDRSWYDGEVSRRERVHQLTGRAAPIPSFDQVVQRLA